MYAIDPETGRYNPILAQILLKEAYDIEYALYNHDDPNLDHPFQTSLYTELKTTRQFSPFERLMETYVSYDIHKFFHISFIEFVNLPADKSDLMVSLATKWKEAEIKTQNKENEVMSKQLRRLEEVAQVKYQDDDNYDPNDFNL